jgi:hypothetical protein
MTQQPICKKDNISVAIISGYRFARASQFVSVISKQSGPVHGPAAILYGRRGGGARPTIFSDVSKHARHSEVVGPLVQ